MCVFPALKRLSRSCRNVKPRSGPVAQQKDLTYCDCRNTERTQLRPGVDAELAGKECGLLVVSGIGHT